LTLHAQFIAVIQILCMQAQLWYCLCLFIMLLNLGDERRLRDGFTWKKVIAGGSGFGVLMELIYIFMDANRIAID